MASPAKDNDGDKQEDSGYAPEGDNPETHPVDRPRRGGAARYYGEEGHFSDDEIKTACNHTQLLSPFHSDDEDGGHQG